MTRYCTECCEPTDVDGTLTLCCWAPSTDQEPDNGLEKFLEAMETSKVDFIIVREHVHSMPANSKKRRGQYRKPTGEDAWPGKIGDDYKKSKRSRKKSPPPQSPTDTVLCQPAEFSGQFHVSVVHPDFKIPEIITGNDRKDARRKARSWLRSKNLTITAASRILEESDKTIIIYE